MMIERVERILHDFSRFLAYLAAFAAALMTGLVILSSIMRYVVYRPFQFTEELVGLLFLCTSLLPLPLIQSSRRPIRISVLIRLLPPRLAWIADIFDHFIVIFFGTWFFSSSLEFTIFNFEIEARSEQSDLLLYPWIAIMPFCSLMVVIVTVVQLLAWISKSGVADRPRGPSFSE